MIEARTEREAVVRMVDGEDLIAGLTDLRADSTIDGHLFAGTVHNTAEVALNLPRGIVLERRTEETGLTGLHPRTT